ncbi:hypothetical protein J3F84DRAFT_200695 [Trichoderma pleuroticola]
MVATLATNVVFIFVSLRREPCLAASLARIHVFVCDEFPMLRHHAHRHAHTYTHILTRPLTLIITLSLFPPPAFTSTTESRPLYHILPVHFWLHVRSMYGALFRTKHTLLFAPPPRDHLTIYLISRSTHFDRTNTHAKVIGPLEQAGLDTLTVRYFVGVPIFIPPCCSPLVVASYLDGEIRRTWNKFKFLE